MKKWIVVLIIGALPIAGCTTTQKGAGIGAATGAVVGAIVGHQSGEEVEGAVVGAAAGAAIGAIIGDQIERRRGAGVSGGSSVDIQVRNMLRATLRTSKYEYKKGEPIFLDFTLENVGHREVYLSSPSFYRDGDLVILVADEDGIIRGPQGKALEFACFTGSGKGMKLLMPGNAFRTRIKVLPTGSPSGEGVEIFVGALNKPGEYRLQAVAYHRYALRAPASPEEYEENTRQAVGVASNWVRIKVVE